MPLQLLLLLLLQGRRTTAPVAEVLGCAAARCVGGRGVLCANC
jgi:hypothetical protein